MSKNNDYTTGNLLHYGYFLEHYKLIAIDLSKQTELENPDLKQISFIGKLEEDEATNAFHHWKIRRNDFWIFIMFCKHHVE